METTTSSDTVSYEQESAQAETTLVAADQRTWMRLAKGDDLPLAIVTGSSGLKTAQIEDVSMGGIGLRVSDGTEFNVGQQVEIEFEGETFRAVVRYKIDHAQGGHRVGMEWTLPTAPSMKALMKHLLSE